MWERHGDIDSVRTTKHNRGIHWYTLAQFRLGTVQQTPTTNHNLAHRTIKRVVKAEKLQSSLVRSPPPPSCVLFKIIKGLIRLWEERAASHRDKVVKTNCVRLLEEQMRRRLRVRTTINSAGYTKFVKSSARFTVLR